MSVHTSPIAYMIFKNNRLDIYYLKLDIVRFIMQDGLAGLEAIDISSLDASSFVLPDYPFLTVTKAPSHSTQLSQVQLQFTVITTITFVQVLQS